MAGYSLGTASGRIVVDGSGAKSGFLVAEAAANGFFAVIDSKLQSVRQLGDNLAKTSAAGAAGMGIAVNAAANFEERLDAVAAVSGATSEEMAKISDAALRIGKDTSFSATEAASAMEELVKAGLTVDEVLSGAADATVALAAAGEISLPQAAEIAAAAMNNFNKTGADMPRVADFIAGAANASAISVGEFGTSMSQVGAVANLVGLSFEDTAVAIAEMGNAGIKGSDAGTSLKTMLMNLQPTTERQATLFKELGLITEDGANQFFNAEGKIKSLAEIQELLRQKTKDMTEEQKLLTLETLFGADAVRAAAILSKEGAAGFNDMAAAMSKVTAAEVAATRMDNLKGSLEELKGSFETALIVIGNYFLPIVDRVVEGITKVVNVFLNAPEGVQKFFAIFIGGGTILAGFLAILIKLSFILIPLLAKFLGFAALKGIFSIFTTGFAAFRSGVGVVAALGAAMTRAGVVFARFATFGKVLFAVLSRIPGLFFLLRGAVAVAFGPWGAAIAAIIAAAVILYKRFEPFRNLMDGIGAAVQRGLGAAQDAFFRLINAFKAGFAGADIAGALSPISAAFIRLGAGARTVWEALKSLGDLFVQRVIPAAIQLGQTVMAAIGPALAQVANAVMTSLWPALQQLWGVIQNQVIPAVVSFAQKLLPIIQFVGMVAAALVGGFFLALFKIAQFIIGTVIPAILQFAGPVLAGLIAIIATVASFIITYLVTPFITFVTFLVGTVIPAVVSFITTLVQGFITGVAQVAAVVGTILGILAMPFQLAWQIIGPILAVLWTLISGAFQVGAAIVQAIVTVMWAVISGAFQIAAAIIGGIMGVIKDLVIMAWRAIDQDVIPIVNAIKTAVEVGFRVMETVINTVMNVIQSVTSAVWGTIKTTFQSAVDTVKTAVDVGFGLLESIVGDKMDAAYDRIQGVWDTITGIFDGASTMLTGAGEDLIRGLITGIGNLAGAVQEKVNGIVSGIKSAITGALSIKSPSRWAMQQGAFVSEGLALGLEQQEDLVAKAATALSSGVMDSIGQWTKTIPYEATIGTRTRDTRTPPPPPAGPTVSVRVDAPQTMSPDQVGKSVATRVGYALSGSVTQIPTMDGAR